MTWCAIVIPMKCEQETDLSNTDVCDSPVNQTSPSRNDDGYINNCTGVTHSLTQASMYSSQESMAQHGAPDNVTTGSSCSRCSLNVSEWVSSFLTAHQHILGYLVPYNDV